MRIFPAADARVESLGAMAMVIRKQAIQLADQVEHPLLGSVIERLKDRSLVAKQMSGLEGTQISGESSELASEENLADLHPVLRPAEAADELGRPDGFRLLKLLGHGGMGAVFLAEDVRLKRRVALKLLRPEFAKKKDAAERFLREAQATATVRHDNVVTIFQVGEDNGTPFMAQELLHGESLHDRLHCEKALPIDEVLRIGLQIAEGLAAAHAHGLLHRDIEPANVWLESSPVAPRQESRGRTEVLAQSSIVGANEAARGIGNPVAERQGYGRVKILDFGLARLVPFIALSKLMKWDLPINNCRTSTSTDWILRFPRAGEFIPANFNVRHVQHKFSF